MRRGDVYWLKLDPTVGTEISKKRPCLIISENVGNEVSSRVTVAAITSSIKNVLPFQVKIRIKNKDGKILLNQIRTIDKQRLDGKITSAKDETMSEVDKALNLYLSLT